MDYSLDLGKIDPPIWRVLIGETVYGPYTLGQLQSFAKENRIRPRSKIAKGDGAPFQVAEEIEALLPSLRHALQSSRSRRAADKNAAHNFIISFNLKSCGDDPIIRQLNEMGIFSAVMPGTYILRSQMTLKAIKTCLDGMLEPTDSVFIADATANRFASINLPMESDIHLRDLWGKKAEDAA